MNEIKIIGKINELLYTATDLCCGWLNKMLPRISDNWWTNCVLDSLSFNQNQLAQEMPNVLNVVVVLHSFQQKTAKQCVA